jgi:hypothetical protein
MKRLLMLICAGAIAMAAPAYADPPSATDEDFLKQLTNAGITYQDPAAAISAGKDVCDLAKAGTSGTEILDNLKQRNPSFAGNGAANFTTIAAAAYCPTALEKSATPPTPSTAPTEGSQPPKPAGT